MTLSRDYRVVLLAPTRRDAAVAVELMARAGIETVSCLSFAAALREVELGAAALIVPEEAVVPDHSARLVAVIAGQPPWSDLPILVVARSGADFDALEQAVAPLGNVTLLERPLRLATLLSAVRTAIRARQRQYQIREYLRDRARSEASLRAADRRKDEFLATLGHELRNPLAPLLSGVQLLRRGLAADRTTDVVAIMERQVTHLTGLVDDLLEVSRITRGLVRVRRTPLELTTAVRAALETVAPAVDTAAHTLTVTWPDGPLLVAGDALRLTQVFANLLTNAAKYTPRGGHLHVGVRAVDGRAEVAVRDDGIGIPADHLASVFDMFVQVDRASRQAQGGLGIGLTLVKTLIDLHDGTVEAHSSGDGQGSEFVVSLPLLTADAPVTPEPTGSPVCRGRRVLVVDDNRDAADTLALLLDACGAEVRTAADGVTALEVLTGFAADAIVLDIGMPHMDGHDLARHIRSLPEHRHTLLIALSGWGQDHDRRRSQDAGFDHHVVKPPDIDRLVGLIAGAGT